MFTIPSRYSRHLLKSVLVLGILVSTASAAAAQACTTLDPPCPPDEPPDVSLSPSGGTYSSAAPAVRIYVFDDYGLNSASWQVTLNGTNVTSSFPLTLNSTRTDGSSSGTIQLVAGSNTLSATICDTDTPSQCTPATGTYTYTPLPPPPEMAIPSLSLAPQQEQYRNRVLCAACTDAALGYATPGYSSLDTPRSVALLYSSARAYPLGLVQVDAFDNSLTPPEKMSLTVLDTSAVVVAERYYVSGNGTTRLAAQFDARALATGAYSYTARVRSWWGSEFRESSVSVRVLIANEQASPFGWGWSMPGLQRVHLGRPDGALVITEGDGSIGFWARASCDGLGNCSYTRPEGDFSDVSYDAATSKYTRRYADGAKLTFASTGLLETAADRFGNTTSYAYSGEQLIRITDPIGKVTELSYGVSGVYGAPGKLAWIRDPSARTTYLGYDASANVTSVVGPDGITAVRAAYDSDHRLRTHWDRTGAATDLAYDAFGELATVTAPEISTSDAGLHRPVTTIRSLEAAMLPAPGTGTSGAPAARVYSDSVRSTVTAPKGAKTETFVHRSGAPTRVVEREPSGKLLVSTWTRNAHGQPTQANTPSGGSVTYTWSGANVTAIRDQRGGTETDIIYETTYNRPERVSINGVVVERSFYSATEPRNLDSTRVDTSVTRYSWDSRGLLLTQTDPDGHLVSVAYEATGMQNTRTVTANGRTTTYGYDAHGRIERVTDPAGRALTATYDTINRVTSTTGPEQTTTQFGYTDATRTTTVTDARNQTYTMVGNALGWVETKTDSRNAVERFAYDRNGNLTVYTNRRGQEVRFAYDTLDRVLTRTADAQTTTFAYDSAATWVAVANEESADTLRTDAKTRPSEAVSVRNGVRYTVKWTYNDEGLVNALEAAGPWGTRNIGYGYDAALRFNWLADMAQKGTSVAYTKDHLPRTVTLPTGNISSQRLQLSLTYSAAHAPLSLGYNQLLDPTLGRRYGHDVLERITSIRRGIPFGSGTYQDETVRSALYDSLGRLSYYDDVRFWEEEGELVCPDPLDLTTCYREIISHADTLRKESYMYDKVGNRTDRGAVIETGNRLSSFDGFTLEYDADGNLTRKVKAGVSDQTFTWNSLGQLTQVITNGTITTFGYDGSGRRVRKTAGGVTSRYLYDGDDLVMELDGAGNAVREYAYYPGTDRPHSVRRSSDGAIFYYTTELPGHVSGLVNAANQVVNRYEYTPFGGEISTTEQVAQPLRYTAREYDSETKLYYNRARYYDPSLARFISEDPIGLEGGINGYAYAGNDPLNARDPFGLAKDGCVSVPAYVTEFVNDEWVTKETTVRLCRGGGSLIGQILDFAAKHGVGRGSAFWGGGVFATSAALTASGQFGGPVKSVVGSLFNMQFDECRRTVVRYTNPNALFGGAPARFDVWLLRLFKYPGGGRLGEGGGAYYVGSIKVIQAGVTDEYLGSAFADCHEATASFIGHTLF